MGNRAFLIAGSRASIVANDDFRYSAASHYVPVGVQASARCHERAETQVLVEDGAVEFMVGGASVMVLAGDFVRIPAGVHYGYRNAGDTIARLLVRSVNPPKAGRTTQINATFAA